MVELDPDNALALVILGNLAPALGEPDKTDGYYAAAFEIEDRQGSSGLASSFARVVSGDFQRGWQNIRAEIRVGDQWFSPLEPAWHGELAPRRTVCIHSFGGLGDVALWARYIPLVAERVGHVVVAVDPGMDRVLASVAALSGVVREAESVPDALYVNTLRLPAVFGTTLETVPVAVPYLDAPATGPHLPPRSNRLRVGIVWSGNPRLWTDPDRSVPHFERLQPLMALPHVEWVSLQVGARADWAEELGIEHRPVLTDFGDTAFVLKQVDLVVSVDTAVANLALAMGIRTWVFPPTIPEFRWGKYGGTSPWYPAARLFWRTHSGDWDGVIQRVAAGLLVEPVPSRTRGEVVTSAARSLGCQE
jgi:hypothetical protein